MVRVINIAVILFFLFFSIVFIFNPFSYKSSQDNGTSNKKLILVVEQDTFYIPFKDGEFNLYSNVVDINGKKHPAYKSIDYIIKDETVSVTHSDCANQICVNTPAISKCGDAIVCAPNKVAFIIDCKDTLKAE